MREPRSKATTLADAVRDHVRPGMHLNFASTPSRSNASILELCRQFRGLTPAFTLSTTGFHSLAHLLAVERLGACYIACFYGDNYPVPRPNPIYQSLMDEGVRLEHWTLGSYVVALRAAACGQPFALSEALLGTSVGVLLRELGRYREQRLDDGSQIGLLSPLVPDVSFLHAPVASDSGLAWFSAPHSEGFWGALAARVGVVITTDRLVRDDALTKRPELIPLPAHRVLAVCEAPFGAHPQPVHFAQAGSPMASYADDFEHYVKWRHWATNPETLRPFREAVYDAADAWGAYRKFVGGAELEALRVQAVDSVDVAYPVAPSPAAAARAPGEVADSNEELDAGERLILLGARTLVAQIRSQHYRSVLAGIGQSFSVARLAKLLLGPAYDVELMVETGLCGFGEPGGKPTDSYLLSRRNIAASRRLSNVDHVLGALVCGGAARCVGVIGCAEVDANGDVNSTLVKGQLLVGSGGACDIAAGAREVIVLARSARLVARVEHVTSRGRGVTRVVTEAGVYVRTAQGWVLTQHSLLGASLPFRHAPFPWGELAVDEASRAEPPTPVERQFLAELRAERQSTDAIEARAIPTKEVSCNTSV